MSVTDTSEIPMNLDAAPRGRRLYNTETAEDYLGGGYYFSHG